MKTILVIEDDVSILSGLKDNLEYEGYAVLTETNGEKGLYAALNKKPDLILLDIMLPGMNGYEVCRKVKKEDPEIPVIMITARGSEMDKVSGLDIGADDYVTKPFSIPELMARIRAAKYFIRHEGEAVHRHDLLNAVWGYEAMPTTRTVDNFILDLRKKLEENPSSPAHIISVRDVGYKFISRIKPEENT
jgi:DNA-binding response OmpR family regulator